MGLRRAKGPGGAFFQAGRKPQRSGKERLVPSFLPRFGFEVEAAVVDVAAASGDWRKRSSWASSGSSLKREGLMSDGHPARIWRDGPRQGV